jgi:imidazolonepropionase-like amidohydrolase
LRDELRNPAGALQGAMVAVIGEAAGRSHARAPRCATVQWSPTSTSAISRWAESGPIHSHARLLGRCADRCDRGRALRPRVETTASSRRCSCEHGAGALARLRACSTTSQGRHCHRRHRRCGVVADVGVRDSPIVAVGTVSEPARETIDATGLVVCPGLRRPAHAL